jgi:hypothetical protein
MFVAASGFCQKVSATASGRRDAVFHRLEAPTLQTAVLDSPENLAHKEIHHEEHTDCRFDCCTIVWCFGWLSAALGHRATRRHCQQLSHPQGKYRDGDWNRNVSARSDSHWNCHGEENHNRHYRNGDLERAEGRHNYFQRDCHEGWQHDNSHRIGHRTEGENCQRQRVGHQQRQWHNHSVWNGNGPERQHWHWQQDGADTAAVVAECVP